MPDTCHLYRGNMSSAGLWPRDSAGAVLCRWRCAGKAWTRVVLCQGKSGSGASLGVSRQFGSGCQVSDVHAQVAAARSGAVCLTGLVRKHHPSGTGGSSEALERFCWLLPPQGGGDRWDPVVC
jgi:hypothetical protein